MAKPKIHWYYGCCWGRACDLQCASAAFAKQAAENPDWYCVTCTKAARRALAKEQPIAVSFSSTVRRCARCRSGAINPSDHGRTEGADLDLCDVCYWRKRAPEPKPITEYAGDDPVLGLCVRHGWLTIKPERSKRSGRVIGWLTRCPSEAYVIPTHFLPLPSEVM